MGKRTKQQYSRNIVGLLEYSRKVLNDMKGIFRYGNVYLVWIWHKLHTGKMNMSGTFYGRGGVGREDPIFQQLFLWNCEIRTLCQIKARPMFWTHRDRFYNWKWNADTILFCLFGKSVLQRQELYYMGSVCVCLCGSPFIKCWQKREGRQGRASLVVNFSQTLPSIFYIWYN